MKTLKKPIVSPAKFREALIHDASGIQTDSHAVPNIDLMIHPEVKTAPAKILVISDRVNSRSTLRKVLQAAHYDVVTAENRAEGVRLAKTVRPDLFLLDLLDRTPSAIPVIKICEQLKMDSATQPIPVIFLAAGSEVEEILAGVDLGAVDCVVKPYLLNELLARIRKALAFQGEQQKFHEAVRTFKNNFIALVSNEIRNHMTVIAGFAALLEQKSGRLEWSAQQAYLQEIVQHADYLAELTDVFESLLRAKEMTEGVDLVKAVTSVVEKFRPLTEKKDQRLILQTPSRTALTVRGYRRDLLTAVGYLLSHVHKHTAPGGAIRVGVASEDRQARIEVTSKDMTLPQNQKNSMPNHEAMDLGLTIAKWVAEQQGGSAGVESRFGQGSCFWMALPLPRPVRERQDEHSNSRFDG